MCFRAGRDPDKKGGVPISSRLQAIKTSKNWSEP